MKLHPTESARRTVEFRRETGGAAPAAPAHEERVTISELARDASRDAPTPARGDVRWYRATRGAPAQGRAPAASGDAAWTGAPESATPAAPASAPGRSARAAIAAYRASMAIAAQ